MSHRSIPANSVHPAAVALVGIVLVGCAPCALAPSSPPASVPPPVPTPVPVASAQYSDAPSTPANSQHASASTADTGLDVVSIAVTNPIAEPRARETIAISFGELSKVVPQTDAAKTFVVDGTDTPVLSQLVDLDGDQAPDEIVFQADFAAEESKSFKLRVGQRPAVSAADYKVYGRFVRERHDDFAWENDFVAHRMYGPDLETWKKDPLTSSGIDAWVKRVRRLVVNEWYMTDNYHQDHGEGADFYSVGKSRGCGGLGIWEKGRLSVSKNFVTSRVIANGPLRLIFELSYAPWLVGRARVSETKRVTLDAGAPFNHFESTFSGRGPLNIGVGIAKHAGGVIEFDAQSSAMQSWEPLKDAQSGNLGCAILLPPGSSAEQQQTESDYLIVTAASTSGATNYYVGTGWDQGGRIANQADWKQEVQSFSRRLASPVQMKLAALPSK